jgi:hypothetical protein
MQIKKEVVAKLCSAAEGAATSSRHRHTHRPATTANPLLRRSARRFPEAFYRTEKRSLYCLYHAKRKEKGGYQAARTTPALL